VEGRKRGGKGFPLIAAEGEGPEVGTGPEKTEERVV